jgi:hypothetical protein
LTALSTRTKSPPFRLRSIRRCTAWKPANLKRQEIGPPSEPAPHVADDKLLAISDAFDCFGYKLREVPDEQLALCGRYRYISANSRNFQ